MTEFRLDINPDWAEMWGVNSAAGNFLKSCNLTADSVDAYTMIICELVENGIKYGSFEKPGDSVRVVITIEHGTISVQVTNPVSRDTQVYLRELDRVVQWIHGYQDPFEAYIERLKTVSRESIENDKSGLGIVRISYEGRASFDFFVDDSQMLSVTAVSEIE